MSYRLTILGCGSSTGVPRVGNEWGKCNPNNPKNRRRRCAALIERFAKGGVTRVLVDSGPDLREQLLDAEVTRLDAVLYTHDHADHTHGIDDLRMLSYVMKKRIDVWMDAATGAGLTERFAYCFDAHQNPFYPAILKSHMITPGEPFAVDGPGGRIKVQPFLQRHGDTQSLGFRVQDFAYSPDVSGLPDESLPFLEGLELWIVDALRDRPHPSHFSVGEALEWIEKLQPTRAVLTHLNTDLDYDRLAEKLPAAVVPAFDGMQFTFQE